MKKIAKSFFLLFIIILCSLGIFLSFQSKVKSHNRFFVKTKVAAGLDMPTDFVFTSDNRIFVTEKSGAVKVIKNGAVLTEPFINLNVDNTGERGVLGIEPDPHFHENHYLYIYYVNANPLEIRVSRFTESDDKVVQGSEVILLKSTQVLNPNHHAGTLRFGPDDKLWITVGNNSVSGNSQDLSNIHGKILRINSDGSIPSDNPFNSAIWAYGLRNPFRFNFLPDGRPIIGDVGEAAWEEIDIGVKGGNYGFPAQEGPCDSCPYINPIYSYAHDNTSASVTGGFASGQNYYFGDYAQGFIKKIEFDPQYTSVTEEEVVDDEAGTVVEILPGINNSFYFLTIFPGELFLMTPTSQGQAPTAVLSANPTFGDAPLSVNFSLEGSSDPAGKPLTYFWDFGDGSTSTEKNPVHTYNNVGKYTARLKVNNGIFDSIEESVDIHVGNFAPEVIINFPAENSKYNAGSTINFSGSATDKEDGVLPAGKFTWDIFFHHQTHIHPYESFTGVKSGSFTVSNIDVPTDSWYEIKLTVADSSGLKTIASRRIDPNQIKITIATNPIGLGFNLDGVPKISPLTFDVVVGSKKNISVSTPQSLNGENFNFESWSDNGALSHTITTPSTDSTITAKFKSAGTGVGDLRFRIQDWDQNNAWTGKFLNDATVKLTDISGSTVYQSKVSGIQDNQDGWVWFNGLPSGTYGIMAYKPGFEGLWKMVNCTTPGGSFNGAVIENTNTQGTKAAWDNNALVEAGKTTVCQDLGLKQITKGSLYFRVGIFEKQGDIYKNLGYLNDATVKLTDTSGNTVIQSTATKKSASGQDGWAYFNDVPAGNYGIMAYKTGHLGAIKFTDCSGLHSPSSIQNNSTEGLSAGWNENVTVIAGKINVCFDLGLQSSNQAKKGSLRFRIQEWDKDDEQSSSAGQNKWTGKFISGATVKLTNQAGDIVVATSSSGIQNNQEGWVFFDDMPIGTYGIMAFKDGFEGTWKQVDCTQPGGSFTNATIQNNLTEGKIAAFDNEAIITGGGVTVCQDLGLKSSIQKGSLRFRIQEWSNNSWTGKFLNDAVVKLTDTLGNTVMATQSSASRNNEDGWVWFDNMPVGAYGIMAYKTGFEGVWKQVDCVDPDGDLTNATINNANTTGLVAAWDNHALIESAKTTVCQDLGLKLIGISGLLNTTSVKPEINEASKSGQTEVKPEPQKESTSSAEEKQESSPKPMEESSSKSATTSAEVK